MARHIEPTAGQIREWKKWVAKRPPHVRAVAEKFDPWTLYRMRSTGHRVTLVSFGEAPDKTVTLTVAVLGRFNATAFERQVFGIDPADLTECDLPAPDEPVGAILTQEQVTGNMDEIRLLVRPDLFRRAPDGSAVRRDTN